MQTQTNLFPSDTVFQNGLFDSHIPSDRPYRIGIIGCGDNKLSKAAPARDLYTSAFFQLKRKYVEATCDEWFIVSAKHHLLQPEQIVSPYNHRLKSSQIGRMAHCLQADFCNVIRDEWLEQKTPGGIKSLIPGKVELVVIAGEPYRKAIERTALGRAYATNPVEGLDLFGQMKWLKGQIEGAE